MILYSQAPRAPGLPLRPQLPAIPSVVLGMLIFVLTEVMFFCALISAYMVIRSHVFGTWAPPGELRLPVAATAFNSLVLLTSGFMMVQSVRRIGQLNGKASARQALLYALLLGAFFVVFQGYEWVHLISYGMSMTSGIFGATFFMLIGSHALHALVAVVAMAIVLRKLSQGKVGADGLKAMAIFWLFVVGVWPVLYCLVYLT
jgi:heme/copper-type cytochrome/quinol oxidase subunit 3